MSKLRKQIEELSRQLQASITSGENRDAIVEYEVLIGELTEVLEKLQQYVIVRICLSDLPGDFAIHPITPDERDQYEKVAGLLKSLSESWEELDYRVRQGDSLTNFTSAIKTFHQENQATNQRIWNAWITSLKQAYEVPEVSFQSQFKAPHLKENALAYQRLAQEFEDLSRALPSLSESISKLEKLTISLNQLRANMDFDLPPEIESFFAHITSHEHGNAVPLALLNSDVIDWLKENGELDNYVVQRKGAKIW